MEWQDMSREDWRDYEKECTDRARESIEHALATIGMYSISTLREDLKARRLRERTIGATACRRALHQAIDEGLVVEVRSDDGWDTVTQVVEKRTQPWSGDGNSAPSWYGKSSTRWYVVETRSGATYSDSALLHVRNLPEMLREHIGEESPFEREMTWTEAFQGRIEQDRKGRWLTWQARKVPHATGSVYFLSKEEVEALLKRVTRTYMRDDTKIHVVGS